MIKIKRVETKRELKQFIQFYYDLYRNNDCAVSDGSTSSTTPKYPPPC